MKGSNIKYSFIFKYLIIKYYFYIGSNYLHYLKIVNYVYIMYLKFNKLFALSAQL